MGKKRKEIIGRSSWHGRLIFLGMVDDNQRAEKYAQWYKDVADLWLNVFQVYKKELYDS